MMLYWVLGVACVAITAWAFCRIGRKADEQAREAMRKHLHDIGEDV